MRLQLTEAQAREMPPLLRCADSLACALEDPEPGARQQFLLQLKDLLEAGLDVNAADTTYGQAPLFRSACAGDVEVRLRGAAISPPLAAYAVASACAPGVTEPLPSRNLLRCCR